ncbi:hypothetical protein Mal15_15390 [Stieleria maiorica]|uniref:STAS domain-containing protein n=1 Tax=Stieleria maiorica TaxID=2795974 RepID=A0A5B9MAF0_9BACT|nr:STAS domain-containing protein [Stieleria maiorica]QEF97499.1 hypothetical protein Mal15_15390 [Stieleria maiorica]
MTIRCDLCVSRTSGGFIVRVQGKGTATHSPAFAAFVKGCLVEDPAATVTVDLLGCEYLDSTFLGCLLKLQRTGTAKRFHVVADDAARSRLLTATCLDKYLTLLSKAPKSTGTFLRIEPDEVSKQELGRHMQEAHEVLGELPSASASVFKRIAEQLAHDLEQEEQDNSMLFDTAVVTPPPRP